MRSYHALVSGKRSHEAIANSSQMLVSQLLFDPIGKIIMGMILGAILSTTNIYIGLKAGWCFGVVITASILSFTIWQVFVKIGLARTPMTILENNCMQSTASAAGYSTGPTLVSAFTL